MEESKINLEDYCINLTMAADRVFDEVGLKCKMWTVSGSNPSEIVSQDSLRVLVAGQEWFPKIIRMYYSNVNAKESYVKYFNRPASYLFRASSGHRESCNCYLSFL